MRFLRFRMANREGLAVVDEQQARGLYKDDPRYPGELLSILAAGGDALERTADVLGKGDPVGLDTVDYLPPLDQSGKIICLGINYIDLWACALLSIGSNCNTIASRIRGSKEESRQSNRGPSRLAWPY